MKSETRKKLWDEFYSTENYSQYIDRARWLKDHGYADVKQEDEELAFKIWRARRPIEKKETTD